MINNPEWLLTCSEVCELLYGIYPFEILKDLYHLKEDDDLIIDVVNDIFEQTATFYRVQDEIYDDFQKLGYKRGVVVPLMYSKKTLEDLKAISLLDDPCELLHTDEDEIYHLLNKQGTTPFFVPNLSQIDDFVEDGYLFNNSLMRLKNILKREYKDELGYIFKKICYGIDIKDLVNDLLPMINIKDTNDLKEVNTYVSVIDDVFVNNAQRKYRGYSYKDLKKIGEKVIIPAMTKSDYLS